MAGDAGALVWVPLERGVTSGAWVLDLRLAGRSAVPSRILAAGLAPAVEIATSPEGRGAKRWTIAITPFAASQLGFELAPGARLCLSSGSVSAWVRAS